MPSVSLLPFWIAMPSVRGPRDSMFGRLIRRIDRSRFASSVGLVLALFAASCGGSASISNAAKQSSWQVILTVNTSSLGGFGIAGVALDGHGNLYLTEMD